MTNFNYCTNSKNNIAELLPTSLTTEGDTIFKNSFVLDITFVHERFRLR